jgi:hypothetical protein
MRRLLIVVAALALPASVLGADTFEFKLSFPDGTPGVMHARVEKAGEKDSDRPSVTCDYFVSQEAEMGLPDMPLGSWSGTAEDKKVDRSAIRSLCLRHYDDALPPD